MMPIGESIKKYAGGVIVPILVLVAALGVYFVLLPRYKTMRAASAAAAEKKSALENQRNTLNDIQKLFAEYDKNKTALAPLDEALPVAPRIPELLANFDELTRQSGLVISSLEIGPAPTLGTAAAGQSVAAVKKTDELLANTENLSIMQIQLGLIGRYVNLKAFLGNLEQNLRLLDIQTLNADEADEKSGDQMYGVVIHAYYQKDGQ